MRRVATQTDLFADAGPDLDDPMEREYIEGLRQGLLATLELVRGASTMPWRNPTSATVQELQFHGIAQRLPEEEATRLRAEFTVEMRRLWAIEYATAPDGADT